MGERTKRRVWPASLAAVLAAVGVMAAFIVLSSAPGAAQAQDQSVCDVADDVTLDALIESGVCPPMLGVSSGLTAIKSSAGTTVELEWTPGANSNVHWVAGALKNDDGSYSGIASLWEKADMNDSHTSDVSGLGAGTYVFTVIAGYYNADTMLESWDSAWVTPFQEVVLP